MAQSELVGIGPPGNSARARSSKAAMAAGKGEQTVPPETVGLPGEAQGSPTRHVGAHPPGVDPAGEVGVDGAGAVSTGEATPRTVVEQPTVAARHVAMPSEMTNAR